MGETMCKMVLQNLTVPGGFLSVGHECEMTLWQYDADGPSSVRLPLPADPEPRVWTSPNDGAISDEIGQVPAVPNTMVFRFKILQPRAFLRLSGKIKSATATKEYRDVKVVPMPLTPTITVVKTVPGGIGVGVLVDGQPSQGPLLVAYGLTSTVEGVARFYQTPEDVGGATSVLVRVPGAVPGLPTETQLGVRYLMQVKPGAWSGAIYAEVWSDVLLGVPRLSVLGPL